MQHSMPAVNMRSTANKRCEKRHNNKLKRLLLQPLFYYYIFPYSWKHKLKKGDKTMADPNKYKSLSVTVTDWQDLGVISSRTNRTRSKMIARLIRFYKENRGDKKNAKANSRAG